MRRAVVLPGRLYDATMPLLALAGGVLERHGYDVRAVSWTLDAPPPDPAAWVSEHLERAAAEGCDLVVAKSLGTWAAPHAAREGWPAVWLTPVLRQEPVAAGIAANPAPQLVVAGRADPLHDVEVARGLPCDVLEVEGADHALSHDGTTALRPDVERRVVDAVGRFVGGLP